MVADSEEQFVDEERQTPSQAAIHFSRPKMSFDNLFSKTWSGRSIAFVSLEPVLNFWQK
jgi:hypothetical protein